MRRLAEPAVRRVLHLYWRQSRGLTLGVRGLVIDPRSRIFLVRHTYVTGWHLPGGGVEPGETAVEALGRELSEEGNIALTDVPELFGIYYNAKVGNRDHVALYVVRDFEQSAERLADREIAAAAFFPLDELPNDTTAGTRARIAEVLMGAPLSARW
ncbi:MAG: NUDIX domain-containing protein [Hyphomicrobiales bacterium]|nr:NUDIX domain-containing protein [Hyphomicrobiales bacterium]